MSDKIVNDGTSASRGIDAALEQSSSGRASSAMSFAAPPHFIIVGAMKCGTSTLHEQLARQHGVFMSTPKEPCFFSDDHVWQRGVGWYHGLFKDAQRGDLCGESSTHYTKLPTHPRTVERMRQHLAPNARFIYLMRHPIDRLVSQYIHEWTQRVIDRPIDEALEAHGELIAYSRYAMQLQPFIEAFGSQRILPLSLERMHAHPQQTLERACRFIGLPGPVLWHGDAAEQNASSERLRASPLRDAIVNFPGMRSLRRRLVPRSWRERIKSLWKLKQRPELSERSLARLRETFDEDLATLGRWLGMPHLRCDNFKQIVGQAPLEWQQCAGTPAA